MALHHARRNWYSTPHHVSLFVKFEKGYQGFWQPLLRILAIHIICRMNGRWCVWYRMLEPMHQLGLPFADGSCLLKYGSIEYNPCAWVEKPRYIQCQIYRTVLDFHLVYVSVQSWFWIWYYKGWQAKDHAKFFIEIIYFTPADAESSWPGMSIFHYTVSCWWCCH